MKLNQIEIENFRCFERLGVSLEDDVTAIIGINAAGKTALLDAIALSLLPLFEDVVHRQPDAGTLDRPTFYRRFAAATFAPSDIRINTAPRPEHGGEQGLLLRTTATYREGVTEQPRRLQWEQEAAVLDSIGHSRLSQRWLFPPGLDTASNGLYVPATAEADSRHIVVPAIAYYRDTRNTQFLQLSADRSDRPSGQDSARHLALDAAGDFSSAQSWFYVQENKELRAAQRHGDINRRDPILSAIRNAVTQMLDGIDKVFADDDPPRMKVEQKAPDGQLMTLDFAQLSSGQRSLMAVTIDFARRLALTHPGWDDPLQAPGILLIDEIELNLHPRWQQTVLPHLRRAFTATQIVVATHSPLVLSTLEARQVRILRDQQLFTPSVETDGTDAGRILRQVMGTETRPPDNPFTRDIDRLFRLINSDALDEAEALLKGLEEDRGTDDPAVIRAGTLIKNRRWEAELGL